MRTPPTPLPTLTPEERTRLRRRMRLIRGLPPTELMTFAQAAFYLGTIKVETLRYYVYRLRLIPLYSLGTPGKRGIARLKKSDLDAYLERCRIPAVREQRDTRSTTPARLHVARQG